MNRYILGIGVVGLFSLFLSCERNEEISKSIEEGTFIGTFTVEYFVEMREGWSSSGTTTLELKNGKYTYTSDIPPKLCVGNYSISDDKIVFEYDRPSSPDDYQVSPYFDIGLILDGVYDYAFDGKRMSFSIIKYNSGYYAYNFEKQ
ncbi:MAG: hypothetical protein LBE91_02975 [Tannerella sp.]|jgi:hypothetical protein|nr:hypothetical protein [Tannerella sp.]